MAKFTDEERTRIVKEFRRRRVWETIIGIPILAGTFVLVWQWRDPEYHFGGFQGSTLTLFGVVVLAFGLVLHYRNWRCPACRRPLHRGNFCHRCGAVFNS